MRALSSCAVLLLLSLVACRVEAGEREIFRWTGDVGPANTVRVRDLNGAITVERAAGAQAEVVVTARWRGAEPEGVRVARAAGAEGTTFCGLWPARAHTCAADGRYDHQGDTDTGGVSLHFRVRVPDGTRLDLSTLNGAIDARTAGAALEARTLNGAIRLQLQRPPTSGRVKLETANGSIRIVTSSSLNADLHAETGNGSIRAFGRRYRHRVKTRLGKGGLDIRARTGNGSIAIEASPSATSIPFWNGCGQNRVPVGIIRRLPCRGSWLRAMA